MKQLSVVILIATLLVCVSLTFAAPQGDQEALQKITDKVCINGDNNSIFELLKLLLNVHIPIKILSS